MKLSSERTSWETKKKIVFAGHQILMLWLSTPKCEFSINQETRNVGRLRMRLSNQWYGASSELQPYKAHTRIHLLFCQSYGARGPKMNQLENLTNPPVKFRNYPCSHFSVIFFKHEQMDRGKKTIVSTKLASAQCNFTGQLSQLEERACMLGSLSWLEKSCPLCLVSYHAESTTSFSPHFLKKKKKKPAQSLFWQVLPFSFGYLCYWVWSAQIAELPPPCLLIKTCWHCTIATSNGLLDSLMGGF